MKKKKLSGLNLNKKTISALKDSEANRLKGGLTECGACHTGYVSCAIACNSGPGNYTQFSACC